MSTGREAFDNAPAWIEANSVVVWRGAVKELRRITTQSSHEFGWPLAAVALEGCVDEWMRDRAPTEPRPWRICRPVVEIPGLTIVVGVGC